MSRRRNLLTRMATLRDIREILGAMKNLALVQTQRVTEFIDAQRASRLVVETCLAEFMADYPELLRFPPPAANILCLIGSERGFCGDFNVRLQAAAAPLLAASPPPAAVVRVGRRLGEGWPLAGAAEVAGAGVAEQVPEVLEALVTALMPFIHPAGTLPLPGLVLLAQGADGVLPLRLLPLPQPRCSVSRRSHPMLLHESPPALLGKLAEAFLERALEQALYESLLLENQFRLEHMDLALKKLDRQVEDLDRRQNQERQETITEEIELTLLAAEAPADTVGHQTSDRFS